MASFFFGSSTPAPVKPKGPAEEMEVIDELWRQLDGSVQDNLVKGGEEGLTYLTLRRWLAARKWSVETANKDLTSHAQWRLDNVPAGKVPEAYIKSQLESGKCCLQGLDSRGRPVMVVLAGRHDPSDDVDVLRKFLIHCMDTCLAVADLELNPRQRICCVFDLSDFAMKNWDLGAARIIVEVLQEHFVERIDKLIIYEPPMFFYGLYKLVQAFLDPVTINKIKFLYKADFVKEFDGWVEPSIIPEHMGGTGSLVYLSEGAERFHRDQPQAHMYKPGDPAPLALYKFLSAQQPEVTADASEQDGKVAGAGQQGTALTV